MATQRQYVKWGTRLITPVVKVPQPLLSGILIHSTSSPSRARTAINLICRCLPDKAINNCSSFRYSSWYTFLPSPTLMISAGKYVENVNEKLQSPSRENSNLFTGAIEINTEQSFFATNDYSFRIDNNGGHGAFYKWYAIIDYFFGTEYLKRSGSCKAQFCNASIWTVMYLP